MILVITSIILGILGFFIGASVGSEPFAMVFCFLGLLCPALFMLEKLYKEIKYREEVNNNLSYDILETLRSNGILTDEEYEKECSVFNEEMEKAENKAKYDDGVNILFKLHQSNIISEDKFHDKIRQLKELYKQKD